MSKSKLLSVLFILAAWVADAQRTDSLAMTCKLIYQQSTPPIVYSYDESTQTHDYSNNWDFDSDGKKDELYFVGTGGAHVYYHLKVVLAKDKKPKEFPLVETDFPVLTAHCIVENEFPILMEDDLSHFDPTSMGFVVAVFGGKRTLYIVVPLDNQSYNANKKQLARKGIKTNKIAISFENGKAKYSGL